MLIVSNVALILPDESAKQLLTLVNEKVRDFLNRSNGHLFGENEQLFYWGSARYLSEVNLESIEESLLKAIEYNNFSYKWTKIKESDSRDQAPQIEVKGEYEPKQFKIRTVMHAEIEVIDLLDMEDDVHGGEYILRKKKK